MILYYTFLFIFSSLFCNISFILDPIFLINDINCIKNAYILNNTNIISSCNIIDSLYINVFLDSNLNQIAFKNNNIDGIIFNNLPILPEGSSYLVLDNNNELSIYNKTKNKIKDQLEYDTIILNNISSDQYKNININNFENNIQIGDINTSNITIDGNNNIVSNNSINTNNDSLLFSINHNKNININNININNSTSFLGDKIKFENMIINNINTIKSNISISNNIICYQDLNLNGFIAIVPHNRILNFNNQSIFIEPKYLSYRDLYIMLDDTDNICVASYFIIDPNYKTILNSNTESSELSILKIGSDSRNDYIYIKPENDSADSFLHINTINPIELNFSNTNNENTNIKCDTLKIDSLDANNLDELIKLAPNIIIDNLFLTSESQVTFQGILMDTYNPKIILNVKNLYYKNLNTFNSENQLAFDSNGLLYLESNSLLDHINILKREEYKNILNEENNTKSDNEYLLKIKNKLIEIIKELDK